MNSNFKEIINSNFDHKFVLYCRLNDQVMNVSNFRFAAYIESTPDSPKIKVEVSRYNDSKEKLLLSIKSESLKKLKEGPLFVTIFVSTDVTEQLGSQVVLNSDSVVASHQECIGLLSHTYQNVVKL